MQRTNPISIPSPSSPMASSSQRRAANNNQSSSPMSPSSAFPSSSLGSSPFPASPPSFPSSPCLHSMCSTTSNFNAMSPCMHSMLTSLDPTLTAATHSHAQGALRGSPNNKNHVEARPIQERPEGPWELTARDLGEGATGRVSHAHNPQGHAAAAKIVRRNMAQPAHEIRNEIRILQKLDHPGIVQYYHHYETESHIYLFAEYAEKGDLYSYVEKNGPLHVAVVKKVILQIVDALFYLHVHKQICHHDIKLENIVIDENFNAKLIDFGYAVDCSAILHPDKRIRSFTGSPAYSAPEVLFRNPHSKSCDVYSLGVCMYFLLFGKFPFCDDNSTFASLCKNVKENTVNFPHDTPASAKELVSRMLCIDNRITLVEIRQHPFFQDE